MPDVASSLYRDKRYTYVLLYLPYPEPRKALPRLARELYKEDYYYNGFVLYKGKRSNISRIDIYSFLWETVSIDDLIHTRNQLRCDRIQKRDISELKILPRDYAKNFQDHPDQDHPELAGDINKKVAQEIDQAFDIVYPKKMKPTLTHMARVDIVYFTKDPRWIIM
ncbi:hypothetical protein DRJ17_05410 [Candidatus Woesearchaeota archaeon]|nr:MAG: hypothetical protein DRJ17_05410 [Candidatus Woesearchaeota archaeon]